MPDMQDGVPVPETAEVQELRHLKRLATARLYRLMEGLLERDCPETPAGKCYWCRVDMHYPLNSDRIYIGDLRGHHQPWCPWTEVLDYKPFWEKDDADQGTQGLPVDRGAHPDGPVRDAGEDRGGELPHA
jgi:hypothetical protein